MKFKAVISLCKNHALETVPANNLYIFIYIISFHFTHKYNILHQNGTRKQ